MEEYLNEIINAHVRIERSISAVAAGGDLAAGGLVGQVLNSNQIANSSAQVAGSILSTSNLVARAGGLVGHIVSSLVTNSHAIVAANISAAASASAATSSYAGGLGGYAVRSQFTNVYVRVEGSIRSLARSGRARSFSYAGGLVGQTGTGAVTNAYAIITGDIVAGAADGTTSYAGGLVGQTFRTYSRPSTIITKAYTVIGGAIASKAASSYAGGLIGTTNNAIDLSDSYYKAQRASSDDQSTFTNINGTRRDLAQLECPTAPGQFCQGATTYTGWDASLWYFGDNRTLPILSPIQQRDTDGDGKRDLVDNCRFHPNPNQTDSDGDQYGDACDHFKHDATEWHDNDADAVGDNADNCAFIANPYQEDYDNDGRGNVCDPDIDGDGIREIRTPAELDAVRTNLTAAYEVIADIDLSGYTNWQPIGNRSHPFRGTFDGKHHTIGPITSEGHEYVGLFGFVRAAAIKNLHLTIGDIASSHHAGFVGGLAGYAGTTNISDVHTIINGQINSTVGYMTYIGGLVGHLASSRINHSHAIINGPLLVDLTLPKYAKAHIGGLVGQADRHSQIANSHAVIKKRLALSIDHNSIFLGGLVGDAQNIQVVSSYALVEDLHSTHSDYVYMGGLIGASVNNTITQAYAILANSITVTSGNFSHVGGLIGNSEEGDVIRETYAAVKGQLSSIAPFAYADGLVGYSGHRPHLQPIRVSASYYRAQRAASDPSPTLSHAHGSRRTLNQLQCPTALERNCHGATTYSWWGGSWDFGDMNTLPTINQARTRDTDEDGKPDFVDNCRLTANPDQRDADGDQYGDACDAFKNNATEWHNNDADAVGDNVDNCDFVTNPRQQDYDGDGHGDACDAFARDPTEWADSDADTLGDNRDNCPTIANRDQANLDGDLLGDLCDPDYDNDGIREIRTPAQLDAVRTNLTAAYEVIAHLDLSGLTNWQPIGNQSHRFRGTFDGRGHMISNVSGPRALFGSLHAATVHNLRLATNSIPVSTSSHLIGSLAEDVYPGSKISKVHVTLNRPIAVRGALPLLSRISGGGLVGYLSASKIVDSQVVINTAHWINISAVTGSSGDIRIGGLVGYSEYSQITNSSVSAKNLSMSTKQHNTYVGGLVGRTLHDQFDNSYALMANIEITASYLSYLGGLIGEASGTSITNSYGIVAGKIASTTNAYAYVGGLVGNLAYGSRINASYAVVKGSLSSVAPHTYAGGLIGHSGPQINVTASYYRAQRASTDRSLAMTNAYGTSRSLNQMQCPTALGRNCHGALTYDGWDESLWDFGNTSTLPTLNPIYARDSDGDGLSDLVDNCRFTSNPDQNNSDGDPYGDACDAFRDNATEWHNSDADALGDNADNCAFITNPRQEDYDNDGQGDACDEDIDNDGRTNADDAFDYDPSEQDDTDHDGIGDHADNCPTIANRYQADLDGDRQGDLCDPDYDNDGIREIRTAAQLDAVRTNLSAAYELIADIDLAHYTSWDPLGAISGGAFTGTFDGRGHRITNLSTSGHQYAGLFGYVWGATLANLNVQAINIAANFSADAAAGGLVGYAYDSDIRNVSVTVAKGLSVASSGLFDYIFTAAGGLVGLILDSRITDASAVLGGNVSTAQRSTMRPYIGGLVGGSSHTTISDSQARVNASLVATTRELPGTRAYAGGLVGWGTHSPISRSHAMVEHHILAESFGNSYGGGLVGYTEYRSHINNSYARIGRIATRSTSTAYAGGLAGQVIFMSNISNSYAFVDNGLSSFEPNNRSYAGGLVGYIDAENAPTNSYYAAQRSPTPDLGTQFTNGYGSARSRRQLECPTGPGQSCQGARTYIGWDAARWLFGDNQTLPGLR